MRNYETIEEDTKGNFLTITDIYIQDIAKYITQRKLRTIM